MTKIINPVTLIHRRDNEAELSKGSGRDGN